MHNAKCTMHKLSGNAGCRAKPPVASRLRRGVTDTHRHIDDAFAYDAAGGGRAPQMHKARCTMHNATRNRAALTSLASLIGAAGACPPGARLGPEPGARSLEPAVASLEPEG
jgi:hypothetical protein